MRKSIVIAISGLALLAGCNSPISLQTHSPKGSLSLQPRVNAGTFRSQAVVTPYAESDINHLQVLLFKVSNSTEIPVLDEEGVHLGKDILNADLGGPVVFDNLDQSTTYRIRAFAYADAATASLISTTDAASYVDVVVTNDDRPTLATLPVQLINKTFSGAATASTITVSTGSVLNEGTESIIAY